MSDEDLIKESVTYAKVNQKEIVRKFVGKIKPTKTPVSIFMAGSPGAGKTEFSKYLIEDILGARDSIVRIDPDEIRVMLPQYVDGKAELFQAAVSICVSKIHDYVKNKSISFLLDGTFSNYEKAKENVTLSLRKGRSVIIQYVVQPPEVAWKFTQDRELVEGRNIKRENFIEQYVNSREVVSRIKKEFGSKVQVDLIERDTIKNTYQFSFNVENIDKYLDKKYSIKELESII